MAYFKVLERLGKKKPNPYGHENIGVRRLLPTPPMKVVQRAEKSLARKRKDPLQPSVRMGKGSFLFCWRARARVSY